MRTCIYLLAMLVLCPYSLFAQDIIYKKDGSEIQAKVLEIENAVIKYKLFTQPEGPTRNISKADIFLIIYQDGTREKFADTPAPQVQPAAVVPVADPPVKKKVIERNPPIPGAPTKIRELYSVGTILIHTKESGYLMLDHSIVKKVTPYNRVKLKSVPPGNHTIQIQGDKNTPVGEVHLQADDLLTYTIYGDSIVLNSSEKKLNQMDDQMHIRSTYLIKKKGFYNLTRIGFGLESIGGEGVFGMSTVNGYQFSPIVSAGIGLGYQSVHDYFWQEKLKIVPLFINVKFNFGNNRVNPFFLVNLGGNLNSMKNKLPITTYSSHQVTEVKSGLYLGGGPGFQIFVKNAFCINVSAELNIMNLTIKETERWDNQIHLSQYKQMTMPIILYLGVGF